MNAEILKIRRRRLANEVQHLKDQIELGKELLRHDPYKSDHRGIRKAIKVLEADLFQAESDKAAVE